MKLTLLSSKGISVKVLPQKCAGRYLLQSRNSDGKLTDILSIEAQLPDSEHPDGAWTIKSNRRFSIIDKDGRVIPTVLLRELELYRIKSNDSDEAFTLFTEPLTEDRARYKGYTINNKNTVITIGRNERNTVCYANRFVSDEHAEMTFSLGKIYVTDLESTNHVYLNKKAIDREYLSYGDVIYIMGLQLIVAKDCIFINNPDNSVTVNKAFLTELKTETFNTQLASEEFEDIPTDYYYRAPRFKYDVDNYELKIDAPPNNQNNDEVPMIMLIGPSMTMGMASVASGVFTVIRAVEQGNLLSAIPSLVMCISMLLGTLMWPLVTKSYQKKLKIKREARRQETYTAYINGLEQEIIDEIGKQERILCENDVSINTYVERVLSANPKIWERTPNHTDFLSLKLGNGDLPFKADIKYPERRFSIDSDNLSDLMYEFGEKKRFLRNVPVCLPLVERYVSGFYGDRKALYSYAKNLLLQLISLHSYDEVKIVLLYDEGSSSDFSFTRWLPHTMNNEHTCRYIATNSEEVKTLSFMLDSIVEERKRISESKVKDEKPYYIVICLDKELTSKADFIRRILECKNNIGFSVLSFFEKLVDLPKECKAVCELENEKGSLTLINDVSDYPVAFRIESSQGIDFEKITDIMANTFVDIGGTTTSLPSKYTFFEMLDIGMIEHLNLAERWSANNAAKSLSVPIGVDKYGELFMLDLHEKAHGPHGLVAGMTGSGKSEFIISYILSLAASFHPNEVAFILIDYKGGGMAKSFENIPHTAGVITNLDGNGIKRSLSSLRSELHRRERIFRDTSAKCNVSNIDIYKYQKLFRDGKVSQPLPHLFIISDEFAELKKEQSDFMSELTSAARVGRSLGVHLILATQKPGGVVDDQIRSNSRFKICLKVQDSSDSQEMLGRPEAAALVDTGRFYLQVGYNELFEIGQSAWSGAPYYPSQKTIRDRDDSVKVINTNGRVIAEANTTPFAMISDPPKQLDVVTDYIAKYCKSENIERWKMWLDPIPSVITVDSLATKYQVKSDEAYELNPVVAEFDDPSHQRQDVLTVPLTKDGNVIVYGSSGSGKEMFVEAMCYSIMKQHTPEEVNIYIMDFGSESLISFEESPFIGDVILSYQTEKVNNLFKLLAGKIETRKKLLSKSGGSMTDYNMQAKKKEPNIVVIINNFAAFNELFEEMSGNISYLTREGIKYGIYFVLTCTGANNVRFNMLQNFKLLYCLRMNNPDDYSSVVGKTDGLVPEEFRGRGIVRIDKDSIVEFQTAVISKEKNSYTAIREFCKSLITRHSESTAVKVPILPEKVTESLLVPYINEKKLDFVPVGVEKASLEIVGFNFCTRPVNMLLSQNGEWKEFSNALCRLVAGKMGIKTIVFAPNENNFNNVETENMDVLTDVNSCAKATHEIYRIALERNNEYKDLLAEGKKPHKYEPLFIVVQSVYALKTMLDSFNSKEEKTAANDTPMNRLRTAMLKCANEYNVHFLICENIGHLSPFTAEDWYRTQVSVMDGIWVGSGAGSQHRMTINKKPRDFSDDLHPDFGIIVNNGAGTLVKLLQ